MSDPTVATCDRAHALQCLEVWGGSGPIHDAVSAPGIDLWISSAPFHGDPTGGDIYYVSVCGCQQVSRFVLADVTGHGGAAGRLAKHPRLLMRTHEAAKTTRFEIAIPGLLSFLIHGDASKPVTGLDRVPREYWPPPHRPDTEQPTVDVGVWTLRFVPALWQRRLDA